MNMKATLFIHSFEYTETGAVHSLVFVLHVVCQVVYHGTGDVVGDDGGHRLW